MLLIFICMLGVISLPRFSQALGEIGFSDNDVSVDTIPENPQPYQDVTVTLTSYATDLNKAAIEWRSGSKTVLSGIGRTTYSFKTLGPNTTTLISVVIAPAESPSDTITKTITISPSEIDILWESVDGYVPPFYRGKSFITSESVIKTVAIPNTTSASKGSIVYAWKRNDTSASSASGYGKDSYIFANSELNKSESVSVSASGVNGGYSAANQISIPILKPEVAFYEKSPTEGVLYGNALGSSTVVSADEMTIVSVPYFLALKGNENKFTYTWKINGSTIDTPSKKTEITIQPTDRGGYATIDVLFDNLSTFFQKASGELTLTL